MIMGDTFHDAVGIEAWMIDLRNTELSSLSPTVVMKWQKLIIDMLQKYSTYPDNFLNQLLTVMHGL